MARPATARVLALAGSAAAIWLLFDLSGLDVTISRVFFDPATGTFPLRDNWWLAAPGHTGLKRLTVGVWFAMTLCSVRLPRRYVGWLPVLREAVAGMALAALLVLWLRGLSPHSCPWDVAGFGGSAQHYPLFGAVPSNPGPGRCVPAAHASSGFALFGLYFALRDRFPAAARMTLWTAWVLGLVAGVVQVARGAHFASHALWTAWVAYVSTFALHALVARLRSLPERSL